MVAFVRRFDSNTRVAINEQATDAVDGEQHE
jgi:hypothetical protein